MLQTGEGNNGMISIEILTLSCCSATQGPALDIETVGIQFSQWVHGSEILFSFATLQKTHGTQLVVFCMGVIHWGSFSVSKQLSRV